ncbi:MAG: sulfatase-like hydrolase/transferase [Myxococcota bacterium]
MTASPNRVPLASRGKPLNVLLIVTDQERARHLIPAGVPLPQRDRLMERSTIFHAAHAATNLCSMSRANLYTGLHAQRNGVWENVPIPNAGQLRRDVSTLGHLFQDAGFITGYFGKWHLTAIDEVNPPGVDFMHSLLSSYGFEHSAQDGERDGTQGGWRYDANSADSAIEFIDRQRHGDRPWLAAVNFVNPHDIMFFQTCERQRATRIMDFPHPIQIAPDDPLYAEDLGIGLPANFGPATLAGKPAAQHEYQKVMELVLGEIPFDRLDLWSAYQNYYWNCLRDVDRQLGRVLDGLEASGQQDRTLVVYTADHGEMAGVHGLREKSGITYREVSNVPLWIRHPDAAAGRTSGALTSMIDILPTLLSGAGIDMADLREHHRELKGVDLMNEIGRSSPTGDRAGDAANGATGEGERSHVLLQWTSLVHVSVALAKFFAGMRMAKTPQERAKAAAGGPPDLAPYRGHMRGLFDGRFKYARYFSPRQHHRPENWDDLIRHNDLELYDTHVDPGETTNLVSDPAAAPRERIESLNRSLNELVDREVGVDDGGHLPGSVEDWRL